MKKINKKSLQGFTLIELLIVIAVLGVLAAVVLVAIDPLEQLARGRDAGRKSTAGQLKNSVQAFYTARGGQWPAEVPASSNWIANLVAAGEMRQEPAQITGATGYTNCTSLAGAGAARNGYCYEANGADSGTTNAGLQVIVFTKLESKIEKAKCTTPATDTAYFVWSSQAALAGTVCYASGVVPDVTAALTSGNFLQ